MKHPTRYYMKYPQKRGAPLKYAELVGILEADRLYTAACIVDVGIDQGMIDGEDLTLQRRIRLSFNKLKHSRQFRIPGDGLVQRKGRRREVAYYGRRWMDAVQQVARVQALRRGKD